MTDSKVTCHRHLGASTARLPSQLPNRLQEPAREDLTYKVASNGREREAAFQLNYRVYQDRGLQKPNPYFARVLPHHLLEATQIFIAKAGDDVVSTVSLVFDSVLGLPMESVYSRQVQQRRSQGIVIAEVCCFADRRSANKLNGIGQLIRLLAQYARYQGVEQLLIAVHPKSAPVYMRCMGFETIGQRTKYPGACDQPAVALCLDFASVDQNPPAYYPRVFGRRIDPRLLQPQSMCEKERAYFRRMVDDLRGWTTETLPAA